MKVLFTHELFKPFIVGGGEIYCENVVKALIKKGIDVTVVAGGWTKSKFEIYEGIPIYRVSLSPTRYSFNIKAFFAIKKVIKEVKPDIIHANTPNSTIPSSIISKFYDIPLVISVHFLFLDTWYEYFNPLISTIFYFGEKIIFKFPYDKIIAMDGWVYHNLCRIGLKNKTILIPHPIDTNKFKPRRCKNEKIVIGTVGTLSGPTKGTNIIINLIKKLKDKYDVDFLIVGPYTKEQKRIFDKIGIKLIGRVPHSIIETYYNKIDVFIGQHMAAKEALACGCYTILNEPTKRLIYYHKNEIEAGIMKCGNPIKLVEEVLENPRIIKSGMKRRAQFIKENYSTEKVISRIIGVYNNLLNK